MAKIYLSDALASLTGTTTIGGNLIIEGGQFDNVTTVDVASYNSLESDYILDVIYTTTGSASVTIPTAQIIEKRVLIIKDGAGNAGTNNITINTEGSETIDGDSNWVINGDNDWLILYFIDGEVRIIG